MKTFNAISIENYFVDESLLSLSCGYQLKNHQAELLTAWVLDLNEGVKDRKQIYIELDAFGVNVLVSPPIY